jgi:hypothetical protein
MSIEAAESGGRERLVNRRVVSNPGVSFSDRSRIGCEFAGKFGIEETGGLRTTAMVHQANDWPDPEFQNSL